MKKRIGSFLLALMMILAFVAPIAATMIATEETYAATTDAQMLAQAKKAKTHTKYVIVSSYSAHKTKVYDTATYKVVKTFTSCGAKDGHTGQYYLTGKKVYDRDGEKKVNGKSVSMNIMLFVTARAATEPAQKDLPSTAYCIKKVHLQSCITIKQVKFKMQTIHIKTTGQQVVQG